MLAPSRQQALKALLAATLCAACTCAEAAMVTRDSLESVLTRASLVIEARVLSIESGDEPPHARHVVIHAAPLATLLGEAPRTSALACRYVEGLIHRRGEKLISPRVTGSGIELRTGAGAHLLLIATVDAAGNCTLLRAEPVSAREEIRRALGKR